MATTDQAVYEQAMQDIIENPADDSVRMIYADWLEEHGQAERGEFIRVQCDLAKWKGKDEDHCPECGEHWQYRVGAGWDEWSDCKNDHRWCSQKHRDLSRRERELLAEHWTDWYTPWPTTESIHCTNLAGDRYPNKDGLVTFRRGFVAEVRCRLTDWIGEECEHCRGRRVIQRAVPPAYGSSIEFREERCPFCHGIGRTNAHGPVIVKSQPVEKVATEKKPANYSGDYDSPWVWHWIADRMYNDCDVWTIHLLPHSVYDLLPERTFKTEQAASDALSAALLKWAKGVNK